MQLSWFECHYDFQFIKLPCLWSIVSKSLKILITNTFWHFHKWFKILWTPIFDTYTINVIKTLNFPIHLSSSEQISFSLWRFYLNPNVCFSALDRFLCTHPWSWSESTPRRRTRQMRLGWTSGSVVPRITKAGKQTRHQAICFVAIGRIFGRPPFKASKVIAQW